MASFLLILCKEVVSCFQTKRNSDIVGVPFDGVHESVEYVPWEEKTISKAFWVSYLPAKSHDANDNSEGNADWPITQQADPLAVIPARAITFLRKQQLGYAALLAPRQIRLRRRSGAWECKGSQREVAGRRT